MPYSKLLGTMLKEGVTVEKQDDGRYKIIAVSTAALEDREGETFTTEAMDYDIAHSKESGNYPEFRVFHKHFLGIGKVTKMARVGIFAVDEGYSYDDPFSLAVCEKMLANNKDGKWKVSRGFNVIEASGVCPDCGSSLMVKTKHMVIGFKCPQCKSMHSNKGSLDKVRFRKTQTFDITITDVPAVPWTGVAAFPISMKLDAQEVIMDKSKLKERLLEAGLEEKEIDDRLNSLSPEALKEFDGIPMAEVLKEFDSEADKDESTADDVFTLDPSVLKEFTSIVRSEMKSAMDGMEIEIEDSPEFKEYDDRLNEIEEKQDEILSLLKELVSEKKEFNPSTDSTPRKFKVVRKQSVPDDEEDEEEEEETDGEEEVKGKKKLPPWLKKSMELEPEGDVIVDGEGVVHKSISDFLLSEVK